MTTHHSPEEKRSSGDRFLDDNSIERRNSEDDSYSPSDVASIMSQDYLVDPHHMNSQYSTWTSFKQRQWQIDWHCIVGQFGKWNVKVFRVCTPSFLHHVCSRNRKRSLELRHDVESGQTNAHPRTKSSDKSSIKSLDGLRGVACLFVFNFHFLYPFTKTATHGYGAPSGDGAKLFTHAHQMPYLSIPYRGRAMVAVFFAISGYVLSCRVLRSLHSGKAHSARQSLSSSTFRRALRLYLPPTISTFAVAIMAWLGMFLSEEQIYHGENQKYIGGQWEEHPHRAVSVSDQLSHWFDMWMAWANPFSWQAYYNLYDPHTWTIPIEFRGSIVLFAVLLGTMAMRSRWRLCTTFLMTSYCLYMGRWDVAIFLGGMFLCEMDLRIGTLENTTSLDNSKRKESIGRHTDDESDRYAAEDNNDRLQTSRQFTSSSSSFFPSFIPFSAIASAHIFNSRISPRREEFSEKNRAGNGEQEVVDHNIDGGDNKKFATLTSYLTLSLKWSVLLLSLYLLSFPDNLPRLTPGYVYLANDLTPSSYQSESQFWHPLGALGLVYSVTNLAPLRRCFEWSVFQYLGHISFAFYLVHGPILHSIGFSLMPALWQWIPFTISNNPNNLTASTATAAASLSSTGEDNGTDSSPDGFDNNATFLIGLFLGWFCLLSISIWCADLFWRFVDVPCTKFARKVEKVLSLKED